MQSLKASMSGWSRDFRFAWRHLLRSPGFTCISILTLALGIGANVAIFTVSKGVLLDPLPYPDSHQLMVVMEANPEKGYPRFSVSPPNWVDFRDQNSTFSHIAATQRASFNLTGEGLVAERTQGRRVTGQFFEVYGTPALLGRWLTSNDDSTEAEKVVVLGHGFWSRRFGASTEVLDTLIQLDGDSYRVVGVMPEGFLTNRDLFAPMAMDYAETNRGAHYLGIRGRLAEGVSVDQARADLRTIAAGLEAQYPDSNTGWTTVVEPLHELMVEDFRAVLFLLTGAVALVLLIACVNVANLLLVRLAEREREIALRSALGAGRWQLVRQWLTETLMVSLIGGGLGILLGIQGTRLLLAWKADDIPRASEIAVDGGVLAFAVGLALVTGLLLGLLPALQASNPDLTGTLKEGGRGQAGGRRGKRIRLGLVLAEVSVAALLLIGAGLLTKSLSGLLEVDPGFEPSGALTANLDLPEAKYPDEESRAAFYERLYERLGTLPGVDSVGAVLPMPLTGHGFILTFYIEGTEMPAPNEFPFSNIRVVNRRYFETMRIPLLRGRDFSEQDTFESRHMIVINRSTAEKYWPDRDPLGQRLTFGDPADEDVRWMTIVGVVGDVHHEDLSEATDPEIYWLDSQNPMDSTALVLRTGGDPLLLTESVRSAVAGLDPDIPIYDVQALETIVESSLAQPRFNSLLIALFAGLALLLASLGVYGVIAYTVSQNTREIGVRLALGAERRRILALILGRGLALVVGGIAIGIGLAFIASRFLSSMIHEVSPTDLGSFAGAAGILILVGLVACLLPAQRAMRVDPAIVLRDE